MTTPADGLANLVQFLHDVAMGHVYRVTQHSATYDRNDRSGRRCTGQTNAAQKAGLVELGPPDRSGFPRWRLTDDGWKVGEAATKGAQP